MSSTRRLAAILAADVAGYSRLMGADEEGTLERLKALRRELIDPKIAEHRGRIVKTTGDGLLVEFASVVDAVRCAVAVQQAMPGRNTGVAADSRIELRIGINLGDVIVEGDDLDGDGVNIAARIEALADAGGVFVSNTVHDHVRDRLPFAFEDLGEQQVKNIARPVRVYRVRDAGIAAKSQSTPTLPLPDRPSIAVLPFANMSGDPEQEYFADGMVEEIITALSRIRWLFVIARNSSFTYKGQAVDVKQVGQELGVRYVLEGSVRKAGGRVRITAQLIDTNNGAHLWADRFDGALEDVFELQDKVALSVAGVIEPALQAAERARSAGRPTGDLTAYDLYLRAYAMVLSSGAIPEALRLMEQAIARDPRYGPALAWTANYYVRRCTDGTSEDPREDSQKGSDFARRALQVTDDDPGTLAQAALALAFFGEDIGAMVALVDRALVLNPSFARGWYISGWLRLWAGQPDLAIEHVELSLRLSPRGRFGAPFGVIGAAHFSARRFDEAAPKLLLAIQDEPNFPAPYRYLAACYAHMGRLSEARDTVGRLRGITPLVVSSASHLRNAEQRELYLSGLRLAAGEDT
jgi:adenylate cyclase